MILSKFLAVPGPVQGGKASAAPGSHEFTDSDLSDASQPEYERYRVPRKLVLLRPKQPYLVWAQQSRDRDLDALRQNPEYAKFLDARVVKRFTLTQLRAQCTAYLIEPKDQSGLNARERVERDFAFFFKRELERWEGTDETHWPASLTLALFR